MQKCSEVPVVHLFVCANRRPEDAPLGPGCGQAGEAVYGALKDEVARRRAFQAVWVTETHCLGICPKRGATVAIYPAQAILTEVEPRDVPVLFARALGEAGGAA
jgi:(2Fe-2S) ferredoxin